MATLRKIEVEFDKFNVVEIWVVKMLPVDGLLICSFRNLQFFYCLLFTYTLKFFLKKGF
jgi:hypothetical protein